MLKGFRVSQFKHPIKNPFITYMGCLSYGFDREASGVVEHIRQHGSIGSYSLGQATIDFCDTVRSYRVKSVAERREARAMAEIAAAEARERLATAKDARSLRVKQAERERQIAQERAAWEAAAPERAKQRERERIAKQEWEAEEQRRRIAEEARERGSWSGPRDPSAIRSPTYTSPTYTIGGTGPPADVERDTVIARLSAVIRDLGHRQAVLTMENGRKLSYQQLLNAIARPVRGEELTPADARIAIQLYYDSKAKGYASMEHQRSTP